MKKIPMTLCGKPSQIITFPCARLWGALLTEQLHCLTEAADAELFPVFSVEKLFMPLNRTLF